MAFAHGLQVLLRNRVRILTHERTRLCWKIAGRAYQHHGFHALRLASREVQQHIAATTDAQSFEAADIQVIKQGEDVISSIMVTKHAGGIGGSPMCAHVRNNQLEMRTPFTDQRRPVLAAACEPMQQDQRLAAAVDFKVEPDAIYRFSAAVHSCPPKKET